MFCAFVVSMLGGTSVGWSQDSANTVLEMESPQITDLVRQGGLATRLDRPRIALALSGGGARGLAQIGVLRAFEDAGIEIDLICGVSMGAIIGGLYACGISPDSLKALAREVHWGELMRNSPPRAELLLAQKNKEANWFVSIPLEHFRPRWPTGVTSGQLLYNYLTKLTQGATYRSKGDFDRLPVRYRALATDLVKGEPVVFDHGEVGFAMRAALAVPLAVTPLRRDSVLYADGGLIEPLPVGLAASLSDEPVVAVNTASGLAKVEDLTDPYAVANQATTVMTAPQLSRALKQADYVCKPNVGQVANFDFDAFDSLYMAGYRAGTSTAEAILRDYSLSSSGCDSAASWRSGFLRLDNDLSLGDCPPAVADVLASEGPVSLCVIRQLVDAAILQGWWTHAVLRSGGRERGHEVWVLSARRPPYLTAIAFNDLRVFDDSTLRRVMDLPVGVRHDHWAIAAALNRIVAYYARNNYTLTAIAGATLSDDGLLQVDVDEALLDRIELYGNEKVKDWVVLRSFPLKPGTPYNAEVVERGLNDLQASGLFRQVTTEVEHTGEGPLLRLHVTEKTRDAVRLGLRHDLEFQTDVFVEWSSINLLGLGNELVVHAQHAPRRDWFFVRARADRVLRTYLTSALTGYRHRYQQRLYSNREEVGSFETDHLGAEFFFGQDIARKAQMALTLNIEDVDFEPTADSTDHINISRLALGARLDDLDDRDFPTRGQRLAAQVTWADEFFGGEVIYRAFEAGGLWVVSSRDRLTLQTSARFATADRHLPLYERFTLGGLRSFMGLNDDELLGDKLVVASILARYQFFTRSYAAGRLDIGTVWDHNTDIDFISDLLGGIGGGLMFDTPLGPLVIMGGITEHDNAEFYFSWGHDF
jgi:NTE family protein